MENVFWSIVALACLWLASYIEIKVLTSEVHKCLRILYAAARSDGDSTVEVDLDEG